MNKRRTIVFFYAFLFDSLFMLANDYNFFSNRKFSGIDFYTGEAISKMRCDEDFNNKTKIKKTSCLIKKIDSNKTNNIIYEFTDGNVTLITNDIRDGRKTFFKYNKNGFLKSFDSQSRSYPEKNTCIIFENNNYDCKITINDKNTLKQVIIERPDIKTKELKISNCYEYKYEDKKLINYIENYYNNNGILSYMRLHSFYYNNDKLTKHTIIVNDELRWIYELFYNEENQLYKVIYKDIKYQSNIRYRYYDCFDKYGNWTHSLEFLDDVLQSEVTRIIEYMDESL